MIDALLRARFVYPMSRAPIENGAIYFREGIVQAVGEWADLSRKFPTTTATDLGDVVVMPGLINAHCHLDYTGMAGMIPPPRSSLAFADWIKSILSLKAHWSYTEFAASWLQGANQLLQSGCTTVLDIEAVSELLPDAWSSTKLRVTSFLEMTGVRSAEDPKRILQNAEAQRTRLPENNRNMAQLSPHALYSTPPELMRLVAAKMRAENILAAVHLAESEAESEMYQNASGPLYDWLKTQRSMDDCGGRSPIQRANELGLLQPNLFAIHCNYLAPGDAPLLGGNRVTVVHCPRSHDYFKHGRFPYEELRDAGVKIALGTDSLASVRAEKKRAPTLDMWEEMRLFAEKNPKIAPAEILAMATINSGSAATHHAGALEANRPADMLAISFSGRVDQLDETLVRQPPRILHRWISGQPV